MSRETAPDYWKCVTTHEAGHAVAALALHNIAADIFVKPTSDASQPYSAAHRWGGNSFQDILSGKADPIDNLVLFAAGATAEAICLGISQSSGFPNDRRKINQLRKMWERQSSEEYWRSLLQGAEGLNQALMEIPQHKIKLEELAGEIDSGYKRTAALIHKHREVLEVIALEAHARVVSIGNQNLTEGTVLLSAARIREIWNSRCEVKPPISVEPE